MGTEKKNGSGCNSRGKIKQYFKKTKTRITVLSINKWVLGTGLGDRRAAGAHYLHTNWSTISVHFLHLT